MRTGLILLWLLAAGVGFAVLLKYQTGSGPIGASPVRWPAGTSLPRDPQRATLLMFAHPQCPCTRASIEELNRLLVQIHDRVNVQVLFYKPGKFSPDWAKTDLWRSVSAIPGVAVVEDVDGVQSRLFGAETSGDVLLYGKDGRLLFKGGITGSRGHTGDNEGVDDIIALCRGQMAKANQTPVYGCSLLGKCDASTGVAAR